MTLAITGATGFVGQALLDAARPVQFEMRALTRNDRLARDGVTWVPGDLADRNVLAQLVKGTEAVVHVAGIVNAPDAAGFEQGNVQGTMRLIDAARQAGVPRFIFVSSLSAREPGLSAYGASKARAEKLVKASGLDWTIVRPPGIFGPRDREMLDVFRSARWGFVPMPPAGRASWLYVHDLARLLLALVPPGEDVSHCIFEMDDGKKGGWTHREWGEAIGAAVGKKPRVVNLSRGLLETAARADRLLRGDRAKLTADRAAYMSHPDWVVRQENAVPASRWRPEMATGEALQETVAWYRQQGWL